MHQSHACTKSNRLTHPFVLSSVAARGRRVRVFEAKHFAFGNRVAVGRDWQKQLTNYEETDEKALITLTVIDVFAPMDL